MVATLFVCGLLRIGASTFASVTGSLVDLTALRGVQKQAKSGHDVKVVQPTLVLTDLELDGLLKCREWVVGVARGQAFERNGGFGETT